MHARLAVLASLIGSSVARVPRAVIVLTSNSKYPAGTPREIDGKTTGWYERSPLLRALPCSKPGLLGSRYLAEAAHPYWAFKDLGFDVTFASVQGGEAPVDPGSLPGDADDVRFWEDGDLQARTKSTVPLRHIDPDQVAWTRSSHDSPSLPSESDP